MNFQFLRENPVHIARYLPQFLQTDPTFRDALENCSAEHELLRLVLQDIVRQLFVEKATWGLTSWERELGLAPRPNASYEDQRKNILLKIQSRQTSTVVFMERLASYFFPDGTKVEIEERNEQNAFRVICDALSSDYAGLLAAIEEYKPAHLTVALDYLMECETQIYAAGYVTEYEIVDIHCSTKASYQIEGLPLYVGGRVDDFEIVDIRSI